jgi:uncharacterized protein YfcZ (UPF0381/DUF406 family)
MTVMMYVLILRLEFVMKDRLDAHESLADLKKKAAQVQSSAPKSATQKKKD